MASSLDRKAPGPVGVFFGAVLSLTLGSLLALVHLASHPVEVLKTAPKEAPGPDAHVLILGASGGTGSGWLAKREALARSAPEGVTLSESDLNAWSTATFEPVKMDEAAKQAPLTIAAGAPNFRVDGSKLQVGLVNTIYAFGNEAPLVLQAKGGFVKGAQGWRYEAEEALLGALPLHRIPGLLPLVAARFGAANPPEEVAKVLANAREIAVREGGVTIVLP